MNSRFGFVAKSLFFTIVGAVILLWMIMSVKNGVLSWGSGAGKMQISAEDAPVVFWAVIAVGGLLGGTVAIGNLAAGIKVLRRPRRAAPAKPR